MQGNGFLLLRRAHEAEIFVGSENRMLVAILTLNNRITFNHEYFIPDFIDSYCTGLRLYA